MQSSGTNSLRKLKRDWWKTRLCTSCVSPLGRIISRGGTCPQCGLRVCKNCRTETLPGSGEWVCVLCNGTPDIFGQTKSLGRDSRSIKRSWTISTPLRAQTNSPVLKSYIPLHPEDSPSVGRKNQEKYADSGRGSRSVSTGSHPSSNAQGSRPNHRQFHSLPRMSSDPDRSKTSKRSSNQEFEKESIKRHRSFQSTLHPYQVQDPPSPSASINFIEDPFWDYYDYEIEASPTDPRSALAFQTRYAKFRSLPHSSSSTSIMFRRNSIRNKLESDMERGVRLNLRTCPSNRSSCERSLGETFDYEYSKNYSFSSNYNSLSDTELNASNNEGLKTDPKDDPNASLSPLRRGSAETGKPTNPSFYKLSTVTPTNSPMSEVRRTLEASSSLQAPVKPERKCNLSRNKRSLSLNSYDGKKLFSPLRTYVVVMKENVVPKDNSNSNSISDSGTGNAANFNVNVNSSVNLGQAQENNSRFSNNSSSHLKKQFNSTTRNSVLNLEPDPGSPQKFHSLPRERVIRIEREDSKFSRPDHRAKNVSKVEITRSTSSAASFPTVNVNVNKSVKDASSRRLIGRSQSYREIPSANKAGTGILKPGMEKEKERFRSVLHIGGEDEEIRPLFLNGNESSATLPLIRAKKSTSTSTSTTSNQKSKSLLNSLLEDRQTATVMENFLRATSQSNEKTSKTEFVQSKMENEREKEAQNFDNYLRQCSTFPRSLQKQRKQEESKGFDTEPNLPRKRHTSTTLITHDDNFGKSSDEGLRVRMSNESNGFHAPVGNFSTGWSATLPHPYVRKRENKNEDFSKEKTRISHVEQEIERDIYFQKTMSLDRGKAKRNSRNDNEMFEISRRDDFDFKAQSPPMPSPRLKRKGKTGHEEDPKISSERQELSGGGIGTNNYLKNKHTTNEPRPGKDLNLNSVQVQASSSSKSEDPNSKQFGAKVSEKLGESSSDSLNKSKMKMTANFNNRKQDSGESVDSLGITAPQEFTNQPPTATPRTRRKFQSNNTDENAPEDGSKCTSSQSQSSPSKAVRFEPHVIRMEKEREHNKSMRMNTNYNHNNKVPHLGTYESFDNGNSPQPLPVPISPSLSNSRKYNSNGSGNSFNTFQYGGERSKPKTFKQAGLVARAIARVKGKARVKKNLSNNSRLKSVETRDSITYISPPPTEAQTHYAVNTSNSSLIQEITPDPLSLPYANRASHDYDEQIESEFGRGKQGGNIATAARVPVTRTDSNPPGILKNSSEQSELGRSPAPQKPKRSSLKKGVPRPPKQPPNPPARSKMEDPDNENLPDLPPLAVDQLTPSSTSSSSSSSYHSNLQESYDLFPEDCESIPDDEEDDDDPIFKSFEDDDVEANQDLIFYPKEAERKQPHPLTSSSEFDVSASFACKPPPQSQPTSTSGKVTNNGVTSNAETGTGGGKGVSSSASAESAKKPKPLLTRLSDPPAPHSSPPATSSTKYNRPHSSSQQSPRNQDNNSGRKSGNSESEEQAFDSSSGAHLLLSSPSPSASAFKGFSWGRSEFFPGGEMEAKEEVPSGIVESVRRALAKERSASPEIPAIPRFHYERRKVKGQESSNSNNNNVTTVDISGDVGIVNSNPATALFNSKRAQLKKVNVSNQLWREDNEKQKQLSQGGRGKTNSANTNGTASSVYPTSDEVSGEIDKREELQAPREGAVGLNLNHTHPVFQQGDPEIHISTIDLKDESFSESTSSKLCVQEGESGKCSTGERESACDTSDKLRTSSDKMAPISTEVDEVRVLEDQEGPQGPPEPQSDADSSASEKGHEVPPPSRRRESPEGQEQEVPAVPHHDPVKKEDNDSKEVKTLGLGEVIIMEKPGKGGKVLSKSEISQNALSQISISRSSPDGADEEGGSSSSLTTTEPEVESPTPMIEQFDVTSDEDSWVEEIVFEDDDSSSPPEGIQMCRKVQPQPPPLDLTLHTIVEESCEESEPESGNFNSPRQRRGQQRGDNELEKYFNFGINHDNAAAGGSASRHSFTNEESEFSDTFSESSFSMTHEDDREESPKRGNNGNEPDPADLAASRLEKYFYNLGLPQSMINPISSINHTQDSDSVGSESESDNSGLEKRKKVLKHHRRSADFEDEFGDQVSDEEEDFFGQDGFDTIKKTARKGKKAGSDGVGVFNPTADVFSSSLLTNKNDAGNEGLRSSDLDVFSRKIPLVMTSSNGTSSSMEESTSNSPPSRRKSASANSGENDSKPVIKVNRSNSFQWSSDEEVNLMMSKLRQLIRNLVKSKADCQAQNSKSQASSRKEDTKPVADKDKQLAYLEGELIRLMKTENLKNIVEYFSSEESDVDDVYKFIKVVKESGSADDSELDLEDPEFLQTLQEKMQSSDSNHSSPKGSPALLAKVMHHIGNRLQVWMKDESIVEDNDDNVTLKCAQSVSSDLNEDRFSWKGSFESALAAKRQSVGSTDSISSSDFTQDRSILRSSSLHHLANSAHHLGQVEEHKEEEESTSSLPRMTNLCNSLPRLNQPSNLSISRAHSLVISGREESTPSPTTPAGPIKSARYRPPGFTPVKSKRLDDEGKSSPALSQSTPMLTQDNSHLKVRSDSMGNIFHDAVKPNIPVKGQIEFGLQYNYKLACLEVRVKQCRDLAAVDAKRNRSDPYVKAYLLPDRSKGGKRKTKTKKNTLHPAFDEVLKFPLTLSDLQNRTLWISVWHSDIFGKNEFLGEVLVDLKDRVFDDPNPQSWDLQEMSGQTEDMPRGDVVIALKWQPKTDSTGNLSVLVKEAKNLAPVRNGGGPSSIIKCSLLSDKSRKQKTSICRRSYNPVWNQTLAFEDAGDDGLEITLWNHDLLSNNELLGTVRLEYDHPLWSSMLSRHSFWVEGILRLN